MDSAEGSDTCRAVLGALEGTVIADTEVLELVLLGVLARGHVLLEDVPGTGKTLTGRSVATTLGLSFSRIQFTPDLLPTDVTGTHVFNERERSFEFREGPIFANVVLGDEINRAPPKTQAALLEAMEERQVTVGGETHQLPEPFFVIATQNPVEAEGSLHPDETLYMNGRLWRAGDALDAAKERGDLVHDGAHTTVYDVGATTQTLRADGTMAERECMVYESAYEGRVYTVETETGRRIRVSGNHPFLVDRDGDMRWVHARDLNSDDALVTPDRLDLPTSPLPGHEAVVDRLGEESPPGPRGRGTGRAARTGGGPQSRTAPGDLRTAGERSSEIPAGAVSASDEQRRSGSRGRETGVGDRGQPAPSPPDGAVANRTKGDGFPRFDRALTHAEAGFFVGSVVADGHVSERSVSVSREGSTDRFDRWTRLARKLGFEPHIRDRDGGREVTIRSGPLVDYLDERYGITTPSAALTAPASFRRTFLERFLAADSPADPDRRRVTFTPDDEETTNLVAHLLLGFGIRPWIDRGSDVNRVTVRGPDVRRLSARFAEARAGRPPTPATTAHQPTAVAGDTRHGPVRRPRPREANGGSEPNRDDPVRRRPAGPAALRDDALGTDGSGAAGDPADRSGLEPGSPGTRSPTAATRERGRPVTAVATDPDPSDHRGRRDDEGVSAPEAGIDGGTDHRPARTRSAGPEPASQGASMAGDVFSDPVTRIDSAPYRGPVIGLCVPGTHNYVAGTGACGINHNTFPLPEAQVDRFAVKTSLGYPDLAGEIELLHRRADRTQRSPDAERVLDGADAVRELQEIPETVRVDDDILEYIARLARATRGSRDVDVGVSPRGTQRLFETSRAHATIVGREYVTPDDVKAVAVPVLAHRLILTPDASVGDVSKGDVIRSVLDEVAVPTVE